MASRAATRQPDIPIAQPAEKLACRQRNVGARSRTPRLRTLRHYLDAAPDCRIPVTALHASFFKFTIGGLSSSMTVTALALQPATRREILISRLVAGCNAKADGHR